MRRSLTDIDIALQQAEADVEAILAPTVETTSITYENSFAEYSTEPVRILTRPLGSSTLVMVTGMVDASSATSGNVAFTLPADLAPKQVRRFICACHSGTAPAGTFSRVNIETDGTVEIYWDSGSHTPGYVALDPVQYLARE